MKRNKVTIGLVLVLMAPLAIAMTTTEAIDLVATQLVDTQITTGEMRGSWPDEPDYIGGTAAGMIAAYHATQDKAYHASATAACDFMFDNYSDGQCLEIDFFGDEAYALMNMQEIRWKQFVYGFYTMRRECPGTQNYIDMFRDAENATAVFYLSHHVLAAYACNATDKDLYRNGLIQALSRIDDTTADFPVLALGAATWALAQTGPLDSTPVGGDPNTSAMWADVKLQDLPVLLAAQQVAAGQENAGSFQWRFDHGDGGAEVLTNGYTDETVYGLLGLIAAQENDPNTVTMLANIDGAKDALLAGINEDGTVQEHVLKTGEPMSVYGARVIEALAAWQRLADAKLIEIME